MMPSLWWQDVRHGVRLLRRQPGVALCAVLVLTLGIGPATALFTLVNAVFFRPWPVPDPHRVAVIRARPAAGEVHGAISVAEYHYLREHARSFSHLAAWQSGPTSIEDGSGQQVAVRSAFVSADYFDALGVRMALGRGFIRSDEDFGSPNAVAVVSHRAWQDVFGADPAILGRTIRVRRQPFTIVGVAPRGFVDPQRQRPTDLWMPLPAQALVPSPSSARTRAADPRAAALGHLAGRLNRGATRASAAAELSDLHGRFREAGPVPSNGIEVIDTRPVSQWPSGSLRTVLPVQAALLLAVVMVLLVACANAGNLLLARALSRRRDIAIQVALGARRGRLIRQLLLEAAVLSTAAGALGFGIALGVPRLMVRLGFAYGPDGFGRIASPGDVDPTFFAPDAVVFWAALLLVALTTVAAGLAPALHATRGALAPVSAERHGSPPGGARWRILLLAVQTALTTVLVLGAGVLTRAITRAASLNPGFSIEDVRTVSVKPEIPPPLMETRGKAFFLALRDALDRTDLAPVAFTDEPPFWDVNLVMMARRPEDPAGRVQQVLMRSVSPNYFTVLAIAIVKGRVPANDPASRELVVNEAAARLLWPDMDPVGRTLLSAVSRTEFETYRVVGVATDVPVRSMSEIEPVVYRLPTWMPVSWTMTLLVRNGAPDVSERVRAVAAGIGPRVTVNEAPLVDYVRGSLATAVLASRGAWAIAALGLLLAMVGTFGVFAYVVEERRHEIGLRLALGALPRQAAAPVLRIAARALGWGLAAGVILSVMAMPVLRHFLYGLNPFDPVAYAGVGGILVVAAGLAIWIPARRAMAADPATTLRRE